VAYVAREAERADRAGGNQEGATKMGVKSNKLEFLLILLSHVLNTDLLVFVFKHKMHIQTNTVSVQWLSIK